MDGRMNGWKEERMDGGLNEWRDEWIEMNE